MSRPLILIAPAIVLLWSASAAGFRACDIDNSYAFSAATRYVVGEISFDPVTGQASGTETTYNYANQDDDGFTECHVTYKLSGIFEPGTGTFLLDTERTNHSVTCQEDFISINYPDTGRYALQMDFDPDGTSLVNSADSGQLVASGEWRPGRTNYKTIEECTIF